VVSRYLVESLKFKKRALGIFNVCTNHDSTMTKQLLKDQYATAGWMTLWEVAFNLDASKTQGASGDGVLVWAEFGLGGDGVLVCGLNLCLVAMVCSCGLVGD
jgi:hypothetical protein